MRDRTGPGGRDVAPSVSCTACLAGHGMARTATNAVEIARVQRNGQASQSAVGDVNFHAYMAANPHSTSGHSGTHSTSKCHLVLFSLSFSYVLSLSLLFLYSFYRLSPWLLLSPRKSLSLPLLSLPLLLNQSLKRRRMKLKMMTTMYVDLSPLSLSLQLFF